MINYHAFNGKLTEARQTALHIEDLALLRGYGIFDYFLVKEGTPMFIEDYLDRFFRSAGLMELDLPVSRAQLLGTVREVIRANDLREGAIRLLATGGYAEDSFTPVSPNWLVLAYEWSPNEKDTFSKGIKLILYQYQRDLPQAKSINYAPAIRLRKKLREAGAFEALYHDNLHVFESFRSNIFFVFDGPVLATPSEGILLGITRKHVLEMSAGQIRTEIRQVGIDEIRHAREAFLTGSNKGLFPVVQIGDQRIGNGEVGPVTRMLMDQWENYQQAYLRDNNAL